MTALRYGAVLVVAAVVVAAVFILRGLDKITIVVDAERGVIDE